MDWQNENISNKENIETPNIYYFLAIWTWIEFILLLILTIINYGISKDFIFLYIFI